MPKTILQIDLIEIRDHIFSLIFRIIDFFDSVKDDNENNFMWHDSGIVQKVLIALLNTLYSRFKHMLWLTVHADTNCQLNSSFRCALKEWQKSVSGRMTNSIRILIEISNLFLIDSDREHLFFFEFIGMVFISFDHH